MVFEALSALFRALLDTILDGKPTTNVLPFLNGLLEIDLSEGGVLLTIINETYMMQPIISFFHQLLIYIIEFN